MVEPDDFGMNDIATLAHVADTRRAGDHTPFWNAWDDQVKQGVPVLTTRADVDQSDPTATHEFQSLRHVRVGGFLVSPRSPDQVRAGLVVLHGYEVSDPLERQASRWAPLADRGVATLLIRLRGYPGSQLDTGPLESPWGLITHGLDACVGADPHPESWIVSRWTADVVLACVVLRQYLSKRAGRPHIPLFLRGDSLGGGLAVLAIARLAGMLGDPCPVQRLVLANPSLADWTWRACLPVDRARGAGGDLARFVRDIGAQGPDVLAALRLFDPVVHARRVQCPTLCRLALRDEIVPAPTSAAVFNALGASRSDRYRFVTRYGHHDGGIAEARRHTLFERCCDEFLDPSREPSKSMPAWEPIARDTAICRLDATPPPREDP